MTQNLIHVVHVSLQLDTGGLERLLVEFAKYTNRDRFKLSFISMTSRGTIGQELTRAGHNVIEMEERPGLRPGIVFRMARILHRLKANVVHLHNTKPMIYGVPAAKLANVPRVVHTRHGQRANAKRGENFLVHSAARFVDHLVCVSNDGAARSIKEGLQKSKVRTIWNGIDSGRFAFTGPKTSGPFIFVGRLNNVKDIPTLLRATRLAADEEPAFRLQIAGTGPSHNELVALVSELNLGANVEFLGEQNCIPPFLQNAGACVLSSLTEGISLSLLEAMSTGLPVVATAVGGNSEVVDAGRTGILVPPEDPAQLSKAMLILWRNPNLAEQMGTAGRQRVEKHFDVRQMVISYESLYSKQFNPASENIPGVV